VAKATLELLPTPPHVKTMLVIFKSMEDAIQSVADIIAAGILPAALEAMDKINLEAIEAFIHAGYPTEAEAVLLIEVDGEKISVSGQVDLIENKCVTDYKNTSGLQEKVKREHYLQANMNAYLAEVNGIEVIHISVVYIDRTWSHLRSTVDPSYPQTPFRHFIHPYERQLAIDTFASTVRDHHEASLGKPRDCTSEEQWSKPDVFALMKVGAKRASKCFDSYAEASTEKKSDQYIEVRKGSKTFCLSFCNLKHLCPQFAREQMQSNSTEP
jgi:hypothetical protein